MVSFPSPASSRRGQIEMSYLLLVAGAIIFVLITVAVLRLGVFTQGAQQTQTRIAGYTDFLNLLVYNATGVNVGRQFPAYTSACQTVNAQTYLYLTSNISYAGSDACFIINGSHVTIDCQGHSITTTVASANAIRNWNGTVKPGYGAITIQNCVFSSVGVTVASFFGANSLAVTGNSFSGGDVFNSNAQSATISGNTFTSLATGVYLFNVSNSSISSNVITSAASNAIYVEASASDSISNNNVTGGWNGINVANGASHTVSGNNVTGTSSTAIFFGAVDASTISNNYIKPAAGNGVVLSGGVGNTISGNIDPGTAVSLSGGGGGISSCTNGPDRYALQVTNATTLTVSGNTWKDVAGGNATYTGLFNCAGGRGVGVGVFSSRFVTLSSNTITNNQGGWGVSGNLMVQTKKGYGVLVKDSVNITLSINALYGNGNYAVFVANSSNLTITGNGLASPGCGVNYDAVSCNANTENVACDSALFSTLAAGACNTTITPVNTPQTATTRFEGN